MNEQVSNGRVEISPRNVPTRRPGPVGGKRDINRRRRTQQLCEAALKLFVARGIESVTIDDIVGEAGVAKGSFYRYFKDKGDLVDALFATLGEELMAALNGCSGALAESQEHDRLVANYESMAHQITKAILSQPKVALLYLQESRSPAVGSRRPVRLLADRINDQAETLTRAAHRHGLLRTVDTRISALATVGAVEKLLFAYLSGKDLGETEDIPAQLVSLLLDGLRAPVPRRTRPAPAAMAQA